MSTQSRIGLEVHNENLPLKAPFRISGYTFHNSPVTLVTLRDASVEGRGEAAGVYYLNDTTDRMLAAIEAHRDARPEVWLGVDANQGYKRDTLDRLLPELKKARVFLLEQPCQRGEEAELDGIDHTIPIAADESVLGLDEVEALAGRFDVLNIKLDKCGGLT